MPTVLALFQLPNLAEQAVAELSLNGFTEKDVAVVLFSSVNKKPKGKGGFAAWLSRGGPLGDTIDRTDGVSVMDGASVGAVFAGILGLVWGSRMRLGSVTIGTLGMLVGGMAGFLVDRLIPEKRRDAYEMARVEGLVMVQVTVLQEERAKAAKKVLKRHMAKQMAVLPGGAPPWPM